MVCSLMLAAHLEEMKDHALAGFVEPPLCAVVGGDAGLVPAGLAHEDVAVAFAANGDGALSLDIAHLDGRSFESGLFEGLDVCHRFGCRGLAVGIGRLDLFDGGVDVLLVALALVRQTQAGLDLPASHTVFVASGVGCFAQRLGAFELQELRFDGIEFKLLCCSRPDKGDGQHESDKLLHG